ncbi:MAG: ABC transporter permease [Clostridia bacterium]|nr:ABC transporter permease [Clostridia bacterium]MBQ8446940.1 ABC transporter permease [Clostridia bacterium]
MEKQFEKNTFAKRVNSMLRVDARRMFTTSLFYIMVGISFVVPILILVMTTMMDGKVSVDPQTGKETVMEGFKNVWQIFGTVSSAGADAGAENAGMGMSITSMCNINMMYFAVAVLVCLFVAEDFRSGYAKNLFTVRAKKTDYVISKTVLCFIGGAAMILAFTLGALIGGKVAGLPYTMDGFNVYNLICCILCKTILVSIFASIFLVMSVVGKHRSWLSLILSFGLGMFLFMTVSIASPLDAGIMHVFICIVGGGMFAVGLGAVSNIILKKTSLV